MGFLVTRLRAIGFAVLVAGILFLGQAPSGAAAASAAPSAAARVVAIAESHLGAPYRYATTGPRTFDCSGLVYSVFREAGVFDRIGNGRYRSALAMYRYFLARGEVSRTNPQVGDLVIYGGGAHVGIYIGGGRVISALVSGVRITGTFALTTPFTAYLHTHLSGAVASGGSSTSTAASGRVTITTVNLRAGPSTSRARIGLVPGGSRVSILRSASDSSHRVWYQVRTASGRVGWIAGWLTRT